MKRVLVTAGATVVPIDQVRAITNIFRGQTGTAIALDFVLAGLRHDPAYDVTLLTSNPNLMAERLRSIPLADARATDNLHVISFKTFDDLYAKMENLITTKENDPFDIIVHSAAVSDYKVGGVCYMDDQTGQLFDLDSSKKVSSDHEELYLRLEQTPKIIDQIREPWGFKGVLVKFKLQVGITDEELLDIAIPSMHHSKADIIVANCLEWSAFRAYIAYTVNGETDEYFQVTRNDLPKELRRMVE